MRTYRVTNEGYLFYVISEKQINIKNNADLVMIILIESRIVLPVMVAKLKMSRRAFNHFFDH